MSNEPSADQIELVSADMRSELMSVGADIRRRATPKALMDTAQASLKRRVENVPARLSDNSVAVALVLAGGAIGVIGTTAFSNRKRETKPAGQAPVTSAAPVRPALGGLFPSGQFQLQLKAALLSAFGVGLGYFGGILLPESSTEDRLLAHPKAVLRQRMDGFLQAHLDGMKLATFNLFGASRLAATALIGVALLAQVMASPASKAEIRQR